MNKKIDEIKQDVLDFMEGKWKNPSPRDEAGVRKILSELELLKTHEVKVAKSKPLPKVETSEDEQPHHPV